MQQASLNFLVSNDDIQEILLGRVRDVFKVLGPCHQGKPGQLVVFDPHATSVAAVGSSGVWLLEQVAQGIFVGKIPKNSVYKLRSEGAWGPQEKYDPYSFSPVLTTQDEHLFNEGTHQNLWKILGAHILTHEGVLGTHFAVWAPNAGRVSVLGDFNGWDGRIHPMRLRGSSGIWEIFLPEITEGARYKYEIIDLNGALLPAKADPFGFGAEHPPLTASVVRDLTKYKWSDDEWIESKNRLGSHASPISIYEVHLPSWRRRPEEGNRSLSYKELSEELIPYVKQMGFTHIEVLPISEHPFDGSWGYQPIGLFAPTIRHGTLDEFREFVDTAHQQGIGIILDWVAGHFPMDAHGLQRFDGTELYEHRSPDEGIHPDWNTLIYNFGRTEVSSFLIANALYWVEEFHIDGLRVDAVASMIYRDYSRPHLAWVRNQYGERENLEAIEFLKQLNSSVYSRYPDVMMIAEESTSYPGVTARVDEGGLGFGFKWNMGWMNDSLRYLKRQAIHRSWHHEELTFGISYAWTENFILPISHDEVVHGKSAMIGKPSGSDWDKMQSLRAFYAYMWTFPGKKLLFMGQEFGQRREWDSAKQLDWELAMRPAHQGFSRLIGDLNYLYSRQSALFSSDRDPENFLWLDVNARQESIFAWVRKSTDGKGPPVVTVVNFTPIERKNWVLPLPEDGVWTEAINTNAEIYEGSGSGNFGQVTAFRSPFYGQPYSAHVVLPALSTIVLIPMRAKDEGINYLR